MQKKRNSSIELFRIITMLLIVASHYVVNSGLVDEINITPVSFKSIFLTLFGAWGSTGINCFVLITGYFMCKSKITKDKFLKILLEYEFYKIIFYVIFVATRYEEFSLNEILKTINPFHSVTTNFVGCYLLFFLFIPVLNTLLDSMTEKMHRYLIILCLFMYSILGTIPQIEVGMNYVSWFIVLYFIASYIRLYPNKITDSLKYSTVLFFGSALFSCLSIITLFILKHENGVYYTYHFVYGVNKIMAVSTSVTAFLFFKNIKMKYNAVINRIATSVFGVLMIHSNSDAMRNLLWKDTLRNCTMYYSQWWFIHALLSVISVFAVCCLIDQIRIIVIEKPLWKYLKAKK